MQKKKTPYVRQAGYKFLTRRKEKLKACIKNNGNSSFSKDQLQYQHPG